MTDHPETAIELARANVQLLNQIHLLKDELFNSNAKQQTLQDNLASYEKINANLNLDMATLRAQAGGYESIAQASGRVAQKLADTHEKLILSDKHNKTLETEIVKLKRELFESKIAKVYDSL